MAYREGNRVPCDAMNRKTQGAVSFFYLLLYQENLNISFVIKGGYNFEIVRLRYLDANAITYFNNCER